MLSLSPPFPPSPAAASAIPIPPLPMMDSKRFLELLLEAGLYLEAAEDEEAARGSSKPLSEARLEFDVDRDPLRALA